MLRGSSFVSSAVTIDNRNRRVVCTHMLCGLQPGRSAEDLIQMAGRVTGNGRSALLENMGVGAKVKILMNHQDFDLVLAYYRFQDELFEGLKTKSIQDMLPPLLEKTGREMKYQYGSNFVPVLGKRTIGRTSMHHNKLSGLLSNPPLLSTSHIAAPLGTWPGAKKRNIELPEGVQFDRPEMTSDEYRKNFPGSYWASHNLHKEFDTKGPWMSNLMSKLTRNFFALVEISSPILIES